MEEQSIIMVEKKKAGSQENKYSKVIKVTPSELISRDEQIEFEARKKFYENLKYSKKKASRIERLQFVGQKIFPVLILLFSTIYFMYGFSQINY